MKSYMLLAIIALLLGVNLQAQKDSIKIKKKDLPQVYNYNNKLDIPLSSVATSISLFNFTQVYSKESSSGESILSLDPNNVNGFNRGADQR